MTNEYYLIAELDKRKPNETHHAEWPKVVAYSFDSSKIFMSEGYGHGLMGGAISLHRFDSSKWGDIFHKTGSIWFLRYLEDGTVSALTSEQDFVNLLKNSGCDVRKFEY